MRRKREPEPHLQQLDLTKLAEDDRAGLESLAQAWPKMTVIDRVFLMGAVAGLIARNMEGSR